jgi:hypothetical protein
VKASCGYKLTSLVVMPERQRLTARFESDYHPTKPIAIDYSWQSAHVLHPNLLPYTWAETVIAAVEDRLSRDLKPKGLPT